MKILYTADPHCGHANIIRMCQRPFSCVDEMDAALIANWNGAVHKDDVVYIIGDFCFRNDKSPAWYLSQLNGHKILVRGNHDKWIENNVAAANMFEEITNLTNVYDQSFGGHHISICHYPLMTWPGKKESYMVFGHIHNDTSMDFWPYIKTHERLLNAGVDINNFTPVTLEQLIQNNKIFKETH